MDHSRSVVGLKFMEDTKYQHLGQSDQARGLPQPPLEQPAAPDRRTIALTRREELAVPPLDLTTAIAERFSLRAYSAEPLQLDELAYLLWATQGVRRLTETSTLRTVPSAGARHAFETYVLANNVTGLEPGLYRYCALAHRLVEHRLGAELGPELARACLNQRFVATSAVTFFYSASVYRMFYRYGERGYRYLHLDAGHVVQNLYLAAQVVGAGCCAIGAYNDDAVNGLLGLDGAEEFVVYAATVGKRPSR